MPVTVKDKGWNLLKAKLNKNVPRVRVGIFGDAAAAKANDSDKTVGQIANAHEHGLGVPQRSWMRATVEANQTDIMAGLRKAARSVLNPLSPKGTEIKLLGQVGQHIAGLMRQRISSGIAPALSERYLPRKLAKYPGATTPLIASGQMIGSIGAEVEGAPNVIKAQRGAARKAAKRALARRRRQRRIDRTQKAIKRLARKGARAATRTLKRQARNVRRALRRRRRRR